MKRRVVVWGILTLLGVFLIALPDDGPRLVTFSELHGPGVVDFIGILLVLVGWFIIVGGIWKSRDKLLQHKGTPLFQMTLLIIGFSYGLIAASVFYDFTLWWAVGIMIILVIHILCVIVVMKK